MTAFFVPKWADEDPRNDEERYAALAKLDGCVALEPHERIESITWIHDGEEWTATVGQQLRGHKSRQARRNGKQVEVKDPRHDGATVLAIMAGRSTMVITNLGLVAGVRSAWVNPLMAGDRPKRIVRFDAPKSEPAETDDVD